MNNINFRPMMHDNGDCLYRPTITKNLSTLLSEYTTSYSKTMVIRFDVTYPKGFKAVEDNSDISALMKLLIQQCSRKGVSPAYFWVREQSLRSNNQHYHCMLLLDGNKTCRYYPYMPQHDYKWQRQRPWLRSWPYRPLTPMIAKYACSMRQEKPRALPAANLWLAQNLLEFRPL